MIDPLEHRLFRDRRIDVAGPLISSEISGGRPSRNAQVAGEAADRHDDGRQQVAISSQ